MNNNKQNANKEKSSKAVVIRTQEECLALFEELNNKVNKVEWMQTTRNGAYKLTISKPEKSEDSHGTLKVGNTTYYLVSAGTTKTALLISFRSYLGYLLKRESVAARLASFPAFDEWCKKQVNDWAKLEAVGVELSDEKKRKLYDNAKAKLGATDDDDESEE